MIKRRAVLASALVLPLGLGGCRSCLPRSDAERARQERQEVEQRIESSLTLVPYRVLKTVLRASKVTPPPPELVELIAQVEALELHKTQLQWVGKTQQIIALITALYRARSILKRADEDRYPLLWQALVGPRLPLPGYDGPAEHLLLATALLATDAALHKDPLTDVLIYELSRAPAKDAWPVELRLWSRAARGLMYLLAGYHYAAEEELTGYLNAVPELGAAAWQRLQLDERHGIHQAVVITLFLQTPVLLSAGYLMRAMNRFAMDRSDRAYDDLEAMLQQLGAAGIDNELSQWAWAMVHIHRKRYDEAAADLARLGASPYLAESERAEILRCSANLRGLNRGFVLFGASRAQLLIASALIARAGGVQNILVQLLGPEDAAKVYAPLTFLSAVAGQLQSGAQSAAEQGEELGRKGLRFLKEQLKR